MMNPVEAVLSVLTKYVSMEGRATRAEFWWWTLIATAVNIALAFVDLSRMTPAELIDLQNGGFFLGLSGIFSLAVFVPSITVAVRRLHDTGRSGLWWFVLFVPFIGAIAYFILMALPSQDRRNRFGTPEGFVGSSGGTGRAMNAYGTLYEADPAQAAAVQADRKTEISEYYRKNILKEG